MLVSSLVLKSEKILHWVSFPMKNSLIGCRFTRKIPSFAAEKFFVGHNPITENSSATLPPLSRQNYKSQLDINLKSFLKLRKVFPRFPSCRICPNAKYKNSEISEISITLLFCSNSRTPYVTCDGFLKKMKS